MPGVVDRIRTCLSQRDGITEESMQPLAMEFAGEVERVNERLAKAAALLRKGLRSEAIQSAMASPNVIDDAAQLDFAEIEDWFDILQFLGIQVPSPVRRDLVDQVNEAIVETQPLEALLKQHRRLAIARAPLNWRLKVLRRIAEVDTYNAFWSDDVEAWEKVRLQQVQNEAAGAVAKEDREAISSLVGELTSTNWIAALEPAILRSLKAKLAELDNRSVHQQLTELSGRMYDAFSEFDEPAARSLVQQWNQLSSKATSPVTQEVVEQAEGAIQWVDELDKEAQQRAERGQAIAQLEHAIDQAHSVHDLERAFNRANTFDPPPPEEIIRRYYLLVEDKRLGKKRLFQATLAGVLAVTIFALVGLVLWQIQSAKDQRLASAVGEMQELVDQQRWVEAQAFFEEQTTVNLEFTQSAELSSLNQTVVAELQRETERAAEFASYLKDADQADPAQIDLSSLARAEKLAVTESEKAEAFKVGRRYQTWNTEYVSGQTAQLMKVLDVQRAMMDDLESGTSDEQTLVRLSNVISEIEDLNSRFPSGYSVAAKQVETAKTRATSLRDAIRSRIDRLRRESAGFESIRKAETFDQLKRALDTFAQRNPESAQVSEFQIALSESERWEVSDDWNAYVNAAEQALRLKLQDGVVASFKLAQEKINSNTHNQLANLPDDVLAPMTLHDQRLQILNDVFGSLASQTLLADFYTIVRNDENKNRCFIYKSYHDREFNGKNRPEGQLGVDVVANESGGVRKEAYANDFRILEEPYTTIRSLATQPDVNRRDFLNDWDRQFLAVAAGVIKQPTLDAKIKEQILYHILDGACQGSSPLKEQLRGPLAVLRQRAEKSSNWFEEAPFTSSLSSDVQQQVVAKLQSVYKLLPVLKNDTSLEKYKVLWVGVLLRLSSDAASASNGVSAVLRKIPEEDGLLFILRAAAGSSKAQWVSIGEFRNGQVSLDRSTDDLIAGRPVFFLPF